VHWHNEIQHAKGMLYLIFHRHMVLCSSTFVVLGASQDKFSDAVSPIADAFQALQHLHLDTM
jgi:hypothetical protein